MRKPKSGRQDDAGATISAQPMSGYPWDVDAPGAAYVAQVRLSTKAGETLADVGGTCERVPETSLAWLISQKLIQRVS